MVSSQSHHSDSRLTSPTLLERIRLRDAEAWETLIDVYGPLVDYWIRRTGLSHHDSSDILQEVFSSVARSIHQFQPMARGSFRAWLWRITRNQLNDFFRSRARQAHAVGGSDAWLQLLSDSQSLADDPDQFTEPSQLTELRRRGLDHVRCQFEEKTWQVFLRVVVQEQATSDVAEEFGITSNTVRQIKSRVLRRLRQVLGEPGNPE